MVLGSFTFHFFRVRKTGTRKQEAREWMRGILWARANSMACTVPRGSCVRRKGLEVRPMGGKEVGLIILSDDTSFDSYCGRLVTVLLSRKILWRKK